MNTIDLILESWDMDHLIPAFIENEIDVEALPNLTEDMIKEIIPKIGPRAKFLNKLNEYKKLMNIGQMDIGLHPNTDQVKEQNLNLANDSSPVGQSQELSLGLSTDQTPPTSSSEFRTISAKEILNSCLTSVSGRSIVKSYKETNSLNEKLRKTLVHMLIDTALEKNDSLEKNFFEELSSSIQELFPTELKEIYYIPGVKKCIAKGKLIDRYRNKRRKLRNCGLLQKRLKFDDTVPTSASPEFQSGEDDENQQSACKNALNLVTDWEEIQNLWEKTFPLRRKDCKDLKGLETIIENWPPLKQPLGYKLIDSDYKKLFPESSSIFIEWDSFEQKIFRTIKDSVQDDTAKEIIHTYESPETNAESKALALLLLLPYACKPSVIKLKHKKSWKPTCVESQESFVNFVKIMGDIDKAIDERKKRALKYGLTVQPFVVIVGQLTNITARYVYINGIRYKIENVLHAIDICFKSFFVFDIEYPMESRQLWTLLQQSIYKLQVPKTQASLSQVAAFLSN